MWVWRLGEALLVAVPNEPYVVFQTELRRRFPDTPLFVLMTTNGGVGYLPPRETYGSGALPGAAVALRARLPGAGDRGGGGSAREPAARARDPGASSAQ